MTVKGPGGGGPPSKLTLLMATPAGRAKVDEAIARVREGIWPSDVARYLGVHRDNLRDWVAKGLAGNPEFAEFAQRYDAADADAFTASMRKCRGGGPEARNEQWFAENRWPKRVGRRLRHELTGRGGGAIAHEVVAKVALLPAVDDPAALDDGPAPGGDLAADAAPGDVPREPG